jgi:hypothetical protein
MGSKLLLSNRFILLEKSVVLKTKNLIYSPQTETSESDNSKYKPVDDFDYMPPKKEEKKVLKEEKIFNSFSELAKEFFESLNR